MKKITNGYYLNPDIVQWLAEKGKQQERSASWYLNKLLSDIRDGEKEPEHAQ